MDLGIAGKTALITGGSRGIGFACARAFLAEGAQVAINSRSAVNLADGKGLWSKNLGPGGDNDRGDGPRGTPTVDGDRLYVLTETGDLWCLRQDGSEVWHRQILKEFAARNISWLLSESPLVDGDLLFVSPGGKGAGVVALNKMNGATTWKSQDLSDEAAYSSLIIADVQGADVQGADVRGVRTLMTFTADAAVGLRAADGKLMFRYKGAANNTANVATPVFFDNKVFFSSGYGTGGALLGLRADRGEGGYLATQGNLNNDIGLPLTLGALFVQQLRDIPVCLRLQKTERQIFEFPLDLPDTQAIGQWRQHLE